jgi:hypothetical protein
MAASGRGKDNDTAHAWVDPFAADVHVPVGTRLLARLRRVLRRLFPSVKGPR